MRIRTSTDLGAYLRARRNELGMDQATLAKKAGTSRKWLVEAEQGKPGAAVGMVLRTLRALDVAIDLSDDHPIAKPVNRKGRPGLTERRSDRTPVSLDRSKLSATQSAPINDLLDQLRKSAKSYREAAKSVRS